MQPFTNVFWGSAQVRSSEAFAAVTIDDVGRNAAPSTRAGGASVDVVIPCYNYARYLRGCVRSVLNQSGVSVRVLVIDDASSDATSEVGRELEASDGRVKFRRHEINRGHIATYNEGLIGWSTADYTVLLSADDMLAPGSLSRAVSLMEADKSVGLVYGSTTHFKKEDEIPLGNARRFTYTRWSGAEWLERRCRAGYNVITSPEVVVRGSVQRAVGGYRAELPHAGDLEMWLRIAAVSNIAYVRGVPQAFYRVHAASMMRTVYRGSFLDLRQRKGAFDGFFEHNRHAVPNADRLSELANRALAREALWDACRAYDRNEVEESHIEELVEFALATYSAAPSLTEFAALRRRRLLGPVVCNRTQLFAAPALVRKIRRLSLKRRWMREGV
jgi:glycosyltransferase involved in cell wall biosynthesis